MTIFIDMDALKTAAFVLFVVIQVALIVNTIVLYREIHRG